MRLSLSTTHNTWPLAGEPGCWSTWGHDTRPQNGWQVSQGKGAHEGQPPRAWELRGGLGLPGWVGLLAEAEQSELVLGFAEEGVWRLGRRKGIVGRRSSRWGRGHFAPTPGIVPFAVPLPGFLLLSPPCHPTPSLPTHTGEAGPPPSTRIEKGETCVRVTFCPTLKDQAAFSSSGIMADFVVQYDVVMEDIIGDVQVRGQGGGHSMSCGVTRVGATTWLISFPQGSVRTSETEQEDVW